METRTQGAPAPLLHGSPAEVLAAALVSLGRPVDAEVLAKRFEAHGSPNSLRALVEVAAERGLAARALKLEAEHARDLATPAVVHLEQDGEAAFGLLLGHDGDAVVLAGPTGFAPARLGPEDFARLFRGVAVELSPSASGEAPPAAAGGGARLADFFGDLLGEGAAGGKHGGWARLTAALAVIALAIAAVLRAGFAADVPGASWALLAAGSAVLLGALLGPWICSDLWRVSRRSAVPTGTPALVARTCGPGKLGDCAGVLSSRWGKVLGLELSALGLAFFLAQGTLLAAAALLPTAQLQGAFAWLAVTHALAVPGALFLVAVQFGPLGRICPLCLAVHAMILTAAAAFAAVLLTGGFADLPWTAFAAPAALWLVAFAAALGVAPAWLELQLERRVLRTRLGWVLASPFGALAELAGRPPVPFPEPAARFQWGDRAAPIAVHALVHPMCSACPPVVEGLDRLVARHPQWVRVALHFAPRDAASAADLALCRALALIGHAAGGEPGLHVLRAVEADPWRHLAEVERGGLAAMLARYLPADFDSAPWLAAAEESVRAAADMASALERGTPTVWVGGRLLDAPLEQLDALLARHGALVAEVVGAGTGR